MIRLGNPWHEEEYDGVIIKLPRALIRVNNLEELLVDFAENLDKQHKLSRCHPDFERSMHEITSYEEKAEFIKKQKERKKQLAESEADYARRRLDREWMDTVWEERKEPVDRETLTVSGCTFDYGYLFTDKKKGLRKKALDEINDLLAGFKHTGEATEFFQDNGYMALYYILRNLTLGEHWRFPLSKQIVYLDCYFNLTIRIEILCVKYFIGKTRYYVIPIGQENKDGRETTTLVFDPRRTDMEMLYYNDFENNGARLIKKK